jgi:hypothetical protein
METLLNRSWFGCESRHSYCQQDVEFNEIINLKSVLKALRNLRDQIRHLHVFHLGTDWLTLVSKWWEGGYSHRNGEMRINPAIVSLEFLPSKLTVHSCALHDLVWFMPTFESLIELYIEAVSARDSDEVALFATSLNRHLYPRLCKFALKSSDLVPRDYIQLFNAIREHGNIISIEFDNVHTFCKTSSFGKGFKVSTSRNAASELQHVLLCHLRGEPISIQELEYRWLRAFQTSGVLITLFSSNSISNAFIRLFTRLNDLCQVKNPTKNSFSSG